jgi:septal ring factor EnvC (AmiA/AmiB activator)
MIENVLELEKGLQEQLKSLTSEIRTAEANLISSKEGYLKVQGALEVLNILKGQLEEKANKQILEACQIMSPD